MKSLLTFLAFLFAVSLSAQKHYVVSGSVTDTQYGQAIEYATVKLLASDSTFISGVSTDASGRFSLSTRKTGNYILAVSYVSYATASKNIVITTSDDTLRVGAIRLSTSDISLGTATVTTTAARVEQVGDTTMFNASAYRVPEGSTLEALVKQFPGIEVSDDGTITWNGKEVTEFLINGKDFFKGDTEIAMKNLPADLVSKVKAYDKASDYTELTGIDDGEETTVLDIQTKKELNQSWITNADLAYGTHDRYSGRLFFSRFTDNSRVSAYGSMNNVNSNSFGGPRGMGGGGGGIITRKEAGMDFTWDNGKERREGGRLEVGGDVRYSHSNSNNQSKSSSETFLTSTSSTSSFSNSLSQSYSSSTSFNTNFRLNWNVDSMTFIMFRPSYSYSRSRSRSYSTTATFNDDPYDYTDDPLTEAFSTSSDTTLVNAALDSITVNTQDKASRSYSRSNNVSATFNIMRRLGTSGRNISLNAQVGYSTSESESFSRSLIRYYGGGSGTSENVYQYSDSPSKNWNYSLRLSYVEPIVKNWYAEARYEFAYSYRDNDRSLYNLDDIAGSLWETGAAELGTLPTVEQLDSVLDIDNSQYATYKDYNHRINVGVRYNTENVRFNASVQLNPQKTKMDYVRTGQNIDTTITRNILNVSPQIRFRYNFSRTNRLEFNFRGSSSQPSMTNLLAVVDDSDPLNISMGNPSLKPSWSYSIRTQYNGYNADRQQGFAANLYFNITTRSISNMMLYDESSGIQYTRPENINGNWSGQGNFMFNTGLGYNKNYTISTNTTVNYTNSVGYVSSSSDLAGYSASNYATNYDYYNAIFAGNTATKNATRTTVIGENLNATYRSDWWDVSLLGQLNYQHSRNQQQSSANLDTWSFSYGASANFTFDFGLSVSTDIRMVSRRGYSDASMNTNELLWNAQISQSFLSNKALTVSVQFYDILKEQSNVSRTISAMMRSDTWTNAINSYCMFHVIYRLNIFSGFSGGGFDMGRGGRGGFGGGGGGGFGGGRPM